MYIGFQSCVQSSLHFYSNYSNETMTITNTNVGIGTSSPTTAKLVIGGTATTSGIDLTTANVYADMRVMQNTHSSIDKDMYIGFQSGTTSSLHFYSNNGETMTVTSGRVGINTSSPPSPYVLAVNGQPAANGYTAFTNYSDARLKTNIRDVEKSLSKIMNLHPVEYRYNETYLKLYNDPSALNKVHKGFIAQEVKEVFPEMVGNVEVNGTSYYDLNTSNLQVYMVKAMQEQQKMIDELKKQNELMQKEIDELKKNK